VTATQNAAGRLSFWQGAAEFEQSIKVLGRARSLTDEPRLLGRIHLHIGVNQAVLERTDQAKVSFETALGFDPTLRMNPEFFKQRLVALFNEVRASLRGELEVTSEREAFVLVDWKVVGKVPFRGKVPIGLHKVAVRTADDRLGSVDKVLVYPNKLARVTAILTALEQPQEGREQREGLLRREDGREQDLAQALRVRKRKTIFAYSALSVGLVLAFSGLVTYGVARSQGNEAYDSYRKATAEHDSDREEEILGLRDEMDSANSKLTASYVLFGIAAAAFGYSVYEFLTRPAYVPQLAVVAGPGGASLSYGCRF
jgi:hypothetical protein